MKPSFFLRSAFLLALFWALSVTHLFAANPFGLHLTQLSDLTAAAPIINSSGSDWGWATITLRLDQLDTNSWQNFFNDCRQKHIIPIVRVSTYNDGPNWKRPTPSDLDNLASFLNSLNWPTTPQHVIPFNEINHGAEWGGEVDITSFANSFTYFAAKLKQHSPNYFILSTPIDLAAPNNFPKHLSAQSVYDELLKNHPRYFELIDGLASHSYPNHGYVGSPYGTGAHSIGGYQWELEYLQNHGVAKSLPVFITETGWPHREGLKPQRSYFPASIAARNLVTAFTNWQQDPRVLAVTPFIFNYYQEPFDHFSWLDSSGQLMEAYQIVLDFPKSPNNPRQLTRFSVSPPALPLLVFPSVTYQSQIRVKNTGQSIWGRGETNFCLEPVSSQINTSRLCVGDARVQPGEEITFKFNFQLDETKINSKTPVYLAWTNTPQFNLTPILTNAHIYKTKFYWQNLLPF